MLQQKQSTEFEPIVLNEDFDSKLSGSFEKLDLQDEPLLKPNDKRFVLFPIQYAEIWGIYKHIESKFWTAEDIELGEDVAEFNESFNGKARSHLIQILCLLFVCQQTTIDICNKFSHEIQIPEARCFIGFQNMQQNVHAELVALLLDQVTEQELREDTASLMISCTSFLAKEGWTQKYISDSKAPFTARLAAFIIYLQIFNSSIFMITFHLSKNRSEPMMPGFVHFVAKLKQDIDSFVSFYQLLLKKYVKTKISDSTIASMILEATKIECDVLTDLNELSGGAGTVPLTSDATIDFEALKRGVIFQAGLLANTFGSGVSALVPKPADNPMSWIQAEFIKERDRYAKHESFVQMKSSVKKSAPEDRKTVLSFDSDF